MPDLARLDPSGVNYPVLTRPRKVTKSDGVPQPKSNVPIRVLRRHTNMKQMM
jgi:hypothetical protein